MGRVSAAADVVLGTPQAISIAVGALLVSLVSYRTMYWIVAGVIAVAAATSCWPLRALDAAVLRLGRCPAGAAQSGVPDGVSRPRCRQRAGCQRATATSTQRGEDGSELEAGRLDGQRNQ